MTYLTDDEQKEIATMETLFASPGYKIFLERAASPDHIKQLQEQYSQVTDIRQLGFLQGQERIIKQVMDYANTYQAMVDAIEAQREDEAKIEGKDREESNLADA